jgi:hypothetical protein
VEARAGLPEARVSAGSERLTSGFQRTEYQAVACRLSNRPGADRERGGNRLIPLYAHPFDPAIPIGSLALAIVAEIDRRMATAARVAKAVR